MGTFLFVIIILAALAAIVMLITRSQGAEEKALRARIGRSGVSNKEPENNWRAVRIRPGLICCLGATELADNIYLSKEAPALPLGGCTEKDCRCHYIHLKDRRSGEDRRIDLGQMNEYLPESGRDRRIAPGGRRLADAAT